MQARTLLAILAVVEFLAICLNFTLAAYVIAITLPFVIMALIALFLAIYCGWRSGIYVFLGCNVLLLLYSCVMIIIILNRGGFQYHPFDMSWNIIQGLAEILCICVALWVLAELAMEERSHHKDDEERKPLFSGWGSN